MGDHRRREVVRASAFMIRTFRHEFDPPNANPIPGRYVELTVEQVEDAALREVLQTPGAALGSWAVLGSLLQPGHAFTFREPLGQSREVKVALSGLFGRFVARAYLERYFHLSVFSHVGTESIVLDGVRRIEIFKRAPGDLPDWIACNSSLTDITIAEAKGCHDTSGPKRALDRAWNQANRVELHVRGSRVTTKRIAIATRWGMATGGPIEPWIAVRDPTDEGDPVEEADRHAIFFGIFRHHVANMISSLGHLELAEALRRIASSRTERAQMAATQQARHLLDQANVEDVVMDDGTEIAGLIGTYVTRAGPLVGTDVSAVNWQAFARVDLRPVFVGVQLESVRRAIDTERLTISDGRSDRPAVPDTVRTDHAGGWIIPLGEGDSAPM